MDFPGDAESARLAFEIAAQYSVAGQQKSGAGDLRGAGGKSFDERLMILLRVISRDADEQQVIRGEAVTCAPFLPRNGSRGVAGDGNAVANQRWKIGQIGRASCRERG